MLFYFTNFLVLFIGGFCFYKPFRFYCLSYFFNWLYPHPKISNFFGIRYVDDTTWITNREESRVYFTGIFVEILKRITDIDFVLPEDVRKQFVHEQVKKGKNIDMCKYFDEINGKRLSIKDFEYFLSTAVLRESNLVFDIIDKETEEKFLKHIRVSRNIMDSLVGSVPKGFYILLTNFWSIVEISRILRSAPREKRLFLHIPQLALINNFSKMIFRNPSDEKGIVNMDKIEPCDFLEPLSKFFVVLNKGDLVFVNRTYDRQNNAVNRAFGPKGTSKSLRCPGNVYSFNFIKSVLTFLQSFEIKVEGTPTYKYGRFKLISNKEELFVTFNKKFENGPIKVVHEDVEVD